jgi:hypothetical protein
MTNTPDPMSLLIEMIADTRLSGKNIQTTNLVVSLASLTFLIDKGLITGQEAVERIRLIRPVWQGDQAQEKTNDLFDAISDFLTRKDAKPAERWTPTVHQGGRQDNDNQDQ